MRARVGLQLREDVAHVALHRLLADEELSSDVGVGHAVGQQLEDLPLPCRQHVLALLGQERGHQRRIDVPITVGHLLDRPHDGLVRSLLQDVALGARLEAARQQAALGEGGEHQHRRLRHVGRDLLGGRKPVHTGHADVEDDDIRLTPLGKRHGRLAVRSLADHTDVLRA